MSADVHAVVVRWRGGDEAAACLQSLADHGGPRLAGVTLVDSGSGDGGAERLAARFGSVRVLALPDNLGFAHAANRGVDAGDAPLQLLLNPDTVVRTGAIDALATLLDEQPRAAGAVPLLEGPDGSTQHRWQLRRLPTAFRLAGGRGGAPAFSAPPDAPRPVPQPAAAAWLVRRRVWRALGGFDEAVVPAWWEDVDFCARLAARLGDPGLDIGEGFVVQPAARIGHRGGSSLAALGDAGFLEAYTRNLLRYAARHHAGRLGCIRAGLRISLMARAALRPARAAAYRAALQAVREP
ncbi:MAG TPA: glycosyltransferase family 2 protein [Chondromyces sp.]|nr:glycosyltransferase family 2 protein [Chondromyces sp.]